MLSVAEGQYRIAADVVDLERVDATKPEGTIPRPETVVYPVPPRI